MFITILIFILLLTLLAEWFIYHRFLATRSRATKWLYYTLTVICTLPYLVLASAGFIWEIFSPVTSIISSTGIVLLLINAAWKTCIFVGALCSLHTSRKSPMLLSYIVAAALMATILYGYLWERHQLRTTRIEIAFDNLPESADGLRIVQIGDLHIGLSPRRHQLLERLTREIVRLQPDLVIDCGDMVNLRYEELDSLSMAILSRVSAPLGVYTVMGNHDQGIYLRDTISLPREENRRLLRERQAQMDWHNITDSTIALPIGGDSLYLTAIDYPQGLKKGSHGVSIEEDYSPHFEGVTQDAFNIVIAHTPTMWQQILAATDAELTLSGHTHSMQMKLPIGERGWSPAALVYDHWSGLYRNGNAALNITDGVGSSLPVRVGAKPEIVVITLKKE